MASHAASHGCCPRDVDGTCAHRTERRSLRNTGTSPGCVPSPVPSCSARTPQCRHCSVVSSTGPPRVPEQRLVLSAVATGLQRGSPHLRPVSNQPLGGQGDAHSDGHNERAAGTGGVSGADPGRRLQTRCGTGNSRESPGDTSSPRNPWSSSPQMAQELAAPQPDSPRQGTAALALRPRPTAARACAVCLWLFLQLPVRPIPWEKKSKSKTHTVVKATQHFLRPREGG